MRVLHHFFAPFTISAMFTFCLLGSLNGHAAPARAPATAVFDLEHKDWTDVLQQSVVVKGSVSQVKYKWLRSNQTVFLRYLKNLSSVTQKAYDGWTDKDKMAFLINAYNAFTLKLVIDNYPIKSIKKIGGLFTNPWKMEFITLLGKKMSLARIESDLGKNFHDARLHFSLNPASIGAPALRSEAYVGSRLDVQLDEQARLFLHDSNRNTLDATNRTLEISKLFDTYKDDFNRDGMTVAKFVAPFITDDDGIRQALMTQDYKVKYLEYDWNLNDSKDD